MAMATIGGLIWSTWNIDRTLLTPPSCAKAAENVNFRGSGMGVAIARSAIAILFLLVAAAAAKADPQAADRQESQEINLFLMVYRFAPGAIPEDLIKTMARAQIIHEQYLYGQKPGSAMREGHRFVFEQTMIEGRAVDFVLEEVLPVYRARLDALAGAMPVDVSFDAYVKHSGLGYQDGEIKVTNQTFTGYGLFHQVYSGDVASLKQTIDPQGARELYQLPKLMAVWDNAEVPKSAPGHSGGGGGYLAIDRILQVPAIKVDAAAAEAMWLRPDCGDQISPVCHEQRRRFDKGFRVQFRMRIDNVVTGEGRPPIVQATLLGVDIVSPFDELVASLPPQDLPPAIDVWQAAADARAEQERLEAEAAAASQQAALDEAAAADAILVARRERLSGADVVGLQLGMSLADAEAAIRARMTVGWRAVPNPDGFYAERRRNPRFPFREMAAFVRDDGEETVTLFAHPTASDRVLALARSVTLAPGTDKAVIAETLMAKYGEDPVIGSPDSPDEWVWTGDFGVVTSRYADDDPKRLREGTCGAGLGRFRLRELSVLEGPPVDPNSGSRVIKAWPSFFWIRGGRLNQLDSPTGEEAWQPALWETCGPMVLAAIEGAGENMTLTVGILDLSMYRPAYEASVATPGGTPAPVPDL